VDPERLAAALDEYLLPAPTPKSRLIELAVRPGDRLPDAFLEVDRGQAVEFRRFRGRQILLNFWQSWSKPCIQELRRLQSLHDQTGQDAPLIFAYGADKESGTLTAVRDQYKLSFSVVHDRRQRMARLFKVCCWPTTVSINAEGFVDHIQFGMSSERRTRVDAHTA
jgi:peroxiredoxin